MTDRSLKDNGRVRGGGEKSRRWPLALDTHDPEQVASFGLRLGYSDDHVVNTLAQECKLDLITARQIVRELKGGMQ